MLKEIDRFLERVVEHPYTKFYLDQLVFACYASSQKILHRSILFKIKHNAVPMEYLFNTNSA